MVELVTHLLQTHLKDLLVVMVDLMQMELVVEVVELLHEDYLTMLMVELEEMVHQIQ